MTQNRDGMLHHRSRRSLSRRVISVGLALGAIGVFAPAPARAHFILEAPASWNSQDALGSPQKLGPCGDEGGTPTGTVTAVQAGQTITVTVNETIFHPGHYRIALAVNNRSELPAEPPVTAGSQACGTVPIESPPVFPVLADGVFAHTSPFNGPQSVQITLPANLTCTHCTLQVIEFMSNHGLNNPGGCFYHHCADLATESPDGGVLPDAGNVFDDAGGDASQTTDAGGGGADGGGGGGGGGTPGGGAGGVGPAPASSSGCSFSVRTEATPVFLGFLGLLALAAIRRRSRKRSAPHRP